MFKILQDRLAKELEVAGIQELEMANLFINGVYLAHHNAFFVTRGFSRRGP
jgi:hypothetical protein